MVATVFVAALLAGSALASPVVPRAKPSNWATGYLENYEVYHTRYLALGCYKQHNTDFFQTCCRPMLATQTLEADRPSYCWPNATEVASATAYEATASASASDDSYESQAFANATSSIANVWSAAEATATASSSNDDWTTELATPTSTYVAPTTTSTSEYVAPTTAASNNNNGGGNVETGGYATYFYQNGVAGACGNVNSDYAMIAAMSTDGWYSNTGSVSQYCGRWLTITNTNNGKSVSVQVADACPSCVNSNSIDLSVGAFTAIASESDGMVPITWSWN